MRKKFFAVVLSMAMAVSMLAGCGSSADDYVSDLETLASISDIDYESAMTEEGVDAIASEIEKLKLTTKEGKALQDDMVELMDLTADLLEMMEDLSNLDEEKLEKYTKDMEALKEKVEKDAEAFEDAAEAAGVEEDDLKNLDLGL
ncbi:MAG: hypothetical protein J6J42_11465 [Lachnospiraceae bacterium]|nr:hypothetical protein [Lachnospiraceae bacterium]MBP3610939.1 hypothetical protein [Lachnospiraceae bacterium]